MGERNAQGEYTPDHSDAEVLAAVRTHEPAATSEVGDELGITRQGADRRLRRLRDEGRVKSKKIGASLVWFDATGGGQRDATECRETPAEPADHSPGQSGGPVNDRHDDASSAAVDQENTDDLADLVGRVVEEVAAPWDDDGRLADRKAAARAVVEYAVESGDYVGRSDAVGGFRAEYPIDGQDEETWWRQNARRVLKEVGDYSRGKHGYKVDRDALREYLDDVNT